MSPTFSAALSILIAMTIGWSLFEAKRDELRCRYCGEVKGHEQDCPYDLNREA